MPFGLISAQDEFQRRMEEAFEGVSGFSVIVDNIIISGKSETEYDVNTQAALTRAREQTIKLNKVKCILKSESIPYFGHVISKDGIHPDPNKVNALKEMPQPCNLKELQTLLGMLNYLSCYIPNLSSQNKQLQTLSKLHKFVWEEVHDNAFNTIKKSILRCSREHLTPKIVLKCEFVDSCLECQLRQQKYYNCHSQDLQELKQGQSVEAQIQGKSWEPAVVLHKHELPRLYVVQTQDMKAYHQNQKYLRMSPDDTDLEQYQHTNSNGESSSEVLGDRKNRKEGCDWKHVSHDLVDVSSIKDIINQNTQSPLVLKFEPFIVHVQAKTLEAAQKLLSCGVQSGFRESGISFRQKSGKINKIIVAIRSTHGIEVPFRFDLVSSEFLGYIIEKVNGLMKENVLRIDRLLSELKKAFP
ncbi:hypothetical protein QYM36_006010 [Artemia franciscana]|uniref:tRNA wybutosine-synthesizing protein 3 homolog n=1 Tax=Artemia franciscana TaxID=6661 RepID=A0AA88HVJ0_ARTSF|nr:hypothetical protein QYM36_006010 [Artemia franciscana]